MLTAHITQRLKTEFPDVPFVFSSPPDPAASLVGPCEELSPLQICDDDDEATIYLGMITHGHLGCYEEGITEDERHRLIAEDVTDFVRDLFSDRIVAMSTLGGAVGGWRRAQCLEAAVCLDPPHPIVPRRAANPMLTANTTISMANNSRLRTGHKLFNFTSTTLQSRPLERF